MNYDLSKTYTENILEQSVIGLGPGLATFENPKDLMSDISKMGELLLPNWKDKHSVAQWVEITTGLLGMIPTPASPFLLAISAGAGIYDAYEYYKEGDYYTATIMAALAILPSAELLKVLRNSPSFKKYGQEQVKKMIELVKNNKATKEIIQNLKKIFSEFADGASEFYKLMLRRLKVIKFVSGLKSLKSSITFINYLIRIGKLPAKFTFMLFGIPYTADRLYVWINRDILQNDKNLDKRLKSELYRNVKMMSLYLQGKDEEIKQMMLEQIAEEINNSDIELVTPKLETEEEIKNQGEKILQEILANRK